MKNPMKHAGIIFLVLLWGMVGVPFHGGAVLAKEPAVSPEAGKFLSTLSDSLAEVAEAVKPSVVNISTTSTVTMEESPFGDLFNDPFFRRFFGDEFDHPGFKRKFKTAALGSGVIVSENGYILTNNHVIQGAEEIKVILIDKREFKGKVVGSDPRTDLAVIKINARDLPVLKFGESSRMKTGDVVLAVGNPFGLNQTITMGIVSAVGRSNVGIADYEDFIQTDAAINPGNSGGALVNAEGRLVGINTAIFSTSGGYMGVGFAIPSDMARTVMESIIKHGKVIRGWLGVSIQDLTPEIAKELGIKAAQGALVTDVMKGSPADKAGLKRGDLFVEFDGKKVQDSAGLRNMAAETSPGKTVTVKIVRDGKEQSLSVTLGEFQEKKPVRKAEKAERERENVLKGVSVQDLTPAIRRNLGIPEETFGVIVANISEDSPAQGVLARNDVIQQINRKDIKNAVDYEQAVSKIGPKDSVLLLVYRGGGYVYVTIKP